MDSETQHILEMVQQGKITPEQAAKLLEALDGPGAAAPPRRARSLHIAVTDMRSGRNTVNVNIPLSLVEAASKIGLTLGVKKAPELSNVDFDEILAAIKSGAAGQIVDIMDEQDHQHVTVSLD